jgi:hypothetical protein
MTARVGRALALGALTIALVGCAGAGRDDDDSSGASGTSLPEMAADAPTGAETAGDAGGGTDVATVATVDPDVATDDRAVIYTASLSVAVDDVRAATAQARAAATAAGGRLHDEQSSGTGETASATLVLKVPPDRFDGVLDELAALGEERSRTVKADDVTAEVVDLEARIKSAQASVDRTRALLAQAKEIGEIVVVESELAKREATLEQLQGQQRVLEGSVAMATVTVQLLTRDLAGPAEDDDDGLPGPLDALETGASSVVAVFSVALLALAVALPWLPIVAAALAVVWWVRRRRSPAARPAAPSAPTA